MSNRVWLHKGVTLFLVLYLLSLQTFHPLAKTLYDGLALLGLFTFLPHWRLLLQDRGVLLFVAASVSFMLIALLSSLLNETHWFSEELRRIIHGTGALLLIPLLIRVRFKMRTLYMAICVAAIGCCLYAAVELWHYGVAHRVGGSKGKPIVFGDVVLMLGLMAASAAFLKAFQRTLWLRLLPLLALVSGLMVSYFSASRGGWLFLPVALVIYLYVFRYHPALSKKAIAGVVSLVVLTTIAVVALEPEKAERLSTGVDEFSGYVESGDRAEMTPVTIRLELWQAALKAFAGAPWLGIGTGSFHEYIQGLKSTGDIPESVAIFEHAHSQYLQTLATNGLLGFVALSLMFTAPLWFYLNATRGASPELLPVLASGALLSGGYAVFCLTDSFFFVSETFVFYMLMQVVLMTSVIKLRSGEAVG